MGIDGERKEYEAHNSGLGRTKEHGCDGVEDHAYDGGCAQITSYDNGDGADHGREDAPKRVDEDDGGSNGGHAFATTKTMPKGKDMPKRGAKACEGR